MSFWGTYHKIDGEDITSIFIIIIISILIVIGLIALFSSHDIKFYYIEYGANNSCVMANKSWSVNVVVYCTDDINKVLQVLKASNEQLKSIKK